MSSLNDSSYPCAICQAIPASTYAYLDRNDELPPAVYQLRRLGEHFRQCPRCQTYYYYDYWPPGPGNIGDREDIDRLTPEETNCLRPILEATDATHLADDLTRAFVSEHERIRKWGKDAYEYLLAQLGFPAILPTLAELLAHSNAQVRQFAIAALAEQAKNHDITYAVAALQSILTDADPIDLQAAEALSHQFLREKKVEELQALLHSQRASVRLGVVYALKIAAYRKTVPAVIIPDITGLLADKQEATRAGAAYVLSDLAEYMELTTAVPALGKALFDTPWVREWAYKALDRAAWKKNDLLPALPFLNRVLTERNEEERIEAARVLQRMTMQDITPVLPALIENLRNSDVLWPFATLREAVAYVIQKFAEQSQANAQLVRTLLRQAKLKKEHNREIRDIYKYLNALKRKAS
jgi:HEAT repeat protein